MIDLQKFIQNNGYDLKNEFRIDGHIHLFDNINGYIDMQYIKKYIFNKCVCFADIDFTGENNFKHLYYKFIKDYYSKDKHILLATATDIDTIKHIYNKYPKIIQGFGELKCYDIHDGEKVPYKKIGFVRQVCKFSTEVGNLPVYVHWELDKKESVEKIEKILEDFPQVPIVLCHCGMDKDSDMNYSFNQAIRMQKEHSNLWLDISYDAVDYFINNILLLNSFVKDRTIIGSDINLFYFKKSSDNKVKGLMKKLNSLNKFINSDFNLKKLFHI